MTGSPPSPFKLDEIGAWSELKLNIIEKYGSAYTTAFSGTGSRLKKIYIDGFSGAGVHIIKTKRTEIEGSPARALKIQPPFDTFHFIDMNADKTAHLRSLCEGRTNVDIRTGDANHHLRELLPTIRYDQYKRALCLLDPYGLHLDWEIIELAGKMKTVDMFLNFPVMDMNRNVLFWKKDRASPDGVERMNRFWGDQSWEKAAYAPSSQLDMFGESELEKQPNKAIADAFRTRLQHVAGFTHVAEPLPMVNKNNAVVYYLKFASNKPVAQNIIDSIFKSARRLR